MAPTGLPQGMKPIECSQEMRQILIQYIIKKRLREKEEAEQSAALIRERKEREQRIRRDNATLEKTKEELSRLQIRLEQLTKERHSLFMELKSVINQEAEQRRRKEEEYNKEKEEILARLTSRLPPPPPPPPLVSSSGLLKRSHSPVDYLSAKIPALSSYPSSGTSGSFYPLSTAIPLRPPPPPPAQLSPNIRFSMMSNLHPSSVSVLSTVKPTATTMATLSKPFTPTAIYRPPFY